MLRSAIALGFAQNVERPFERHLRVRPMDEQEIYPGELQISQTLLKRAFEIGSRQPIVENLGRHEDLLARKAGRAKTAAQSLPHLGLVAIALGGVDVAITETDCRL